MVYGGNQNGQGFFRITGQDTLVHPFLSFPRGEGFENPAAPNEHYIFLTNFQNDKSRSYEFQGDSCVQIAHPFDSIPWRHIVFNKMDDAYWVNEEGKLSRYDKNFKLTRQFTVSDGLPEWDVWSMVVDKAGNIWFSTDRSINQLNVETGIFSTLTEKDGFTPMNFSFGLRLKVSSTGDIYLASGVNGEGFVRIRPDKFTSTAASVYLKSVEINQEKFPLATGINNLTELSLKHFQNNISIETGTIDFYSKGNSKIRYKINEINDKWQYAPANYTVRYDGISPGRYTLEMQASNAANEFIGPVRTLLINIASPWWNTGWAYLLYILTFGTVTSALINYRSRSLRRQNMLLEETVSNRTQELKKSLEDLKATQSQLIHSEKMASLGELTAGIAHEIQNPLNFVNNFSEVNKELFDELQEEIEKGDKDEISAILKDLRDNEDKIILHGRRADSIVKNMLFHSRTSSGEKELTDVNAMCDEYLRLAYHGLRAKDKSFNATFRTELDPDLPNIKVVPQDIGRVLLNLINNAFQACAEASKLVKADNLAKPNYAPLVIVSSKKLTNAIEIRITDNGTGIPDNIKDKIFQPFFTTKQTGQGTGLGLSLSYDIIKAHGGRINVESIPDEGTNFIIELPI